MSAYTERKSLIKELFRPVADLLNKEESFVVATHEQPDGDALGSALALGLILKGMNKRVSVSFGSYPDVPPQYRFLPGVESLANPQDIDPAPAFIAVDCGQVDRLGPLKKLALEAGNLVNIDHHIGNDGYGSINVVLTESSSCGEILFELFEFLRVADMGVDVSLLLYTAILTDTGCFQYRNTSHRTLEIALSLIKSGAIIPYEIYQKVYESQSFGRLRMMGLAFSKVAFRRESGFIYTTITGADLRESGGSLEEAENLVNHLRSVVGVKVAALFKEMDDGTVKVSLRSRGDVDVNKVAAAFAGGGHREAAGYSYPGKLEKAVELLEGELAD